MFTDKFIRDFFRDKFIFIFLVAALIAPLFTHLSDLPITAYDESRIIANALDLMENNHVIVAHFDGSPDMWNTKPPLLLWIQSLFMKIGGVSEFTFRLPSALAALLTCLCLYFFSIFYLKNSLVAIASALILVSSSGFVSSHVSRTGDYDAMLTLFTTTSCLLFFLYMQLHANRFLWGFFILISLACFTKGIAGLLFAPAYFLYIIFNNQLKFVLKNKHFYLGIVFFIVIVFGYYFIREILNPGYLKAVYENELWGRYQEVNEGHGGDFLYYYNYLINHQFSYWIVFVPLSFLLIFFEKNEQLKKLSIYLTLVIFTYFLILSFSKTKLYWYATPLLPLLSLLSSFSIYYVVKKIRLLFNFKSQLLSSYFSAGIFLLIAFYPYNQVLQTSIHPIRHLHPKTAEFEMSYYLKNALHKNYQMNNCFIVFEGYNTPLDFYVKMLNAKQHHVQFKGKEILNEGDTIVASQEYIKDFLANQYQLDILENNSPPVIKYRIVNKKVTLSKS